MILSRIIGTVKNEDGTIETKGKISQFSVFIGSSPAKNVYCTQSTKTPFEAYNNFLLENAPVNTFNRSKYQTGDTMNSTAKYDSYIKAVTITSTSGTSYNANTLVDWLHPEDTTLYRTKSSGPAPGEWPSPVFIETPRGNIIQVSEDSSFTKYYEYQVKTHVTDIYNLIPSKHYFYRILEGTTVIKTGEFDTYGQVRFIKLIALRNVRDSGGWLTVDGQSRFKYGVIFRGSGLNFFVSDSINTAANRALDLATLENDFGVTGEVDLNGSLELDPFYVGHNNSSENILSFSASCYYGMPAAYSQFYNVLNFIIQKVENGGAVYVHCLQGRDRTGSFISVIQALCGVCDDGILKDYELTSFWGNSTYRYYLEYDDSANTSKSMWRLFASSGTSQERVQSWFKSNYVANSIGNKATAEEAIEYVKSLLLEPIQQEEPIPEADEHTIENPLVQNYLRTKSYSAENVTSTTTVGISQADLMGYDRMVNCNKYASYKNENFISSDYIINSKPNPYVIDVTGATSVELSDGNNTYVIANTNGTFTSKIKQDSVVSVSFNDLPVIGPSSYNSNTDTPIKIWNLIPNKRYTYVVKGNNDTVLKSGVINVTGQVRMLHFEGVLNVRDLGGWPCYDDSNNQVGTVAYDKLYRGGQPDSSTYWNKIGVTNNDARMMTDFVKLGYQIDLRESDTDSSGETAYKGSSSNKCSRFGKDTSTNKIPWERVRIIPYWRGIDYVTGTDESPNTTPIANIFTCLGKIIKNLNSNISTYFNCSQGADRTGLIAMIIEALIGVDDDSILKDWELTCFSGAMLTYSGAIYNEGSDYRAIHKDCSKYTGYMVELKDNLFTYYPSSDGVNTIQKCLTNWFIQVSKLQAITTAAGNQWLHIGHGSDSGSKKTLSQSSTNSYLTKLNTASGLIFNTPEEVIAFLKNKLIVNF